MKYKERLACIYEPTNYKRGPLVVKSTALVDYNELFGTYKVRNGKYKGLTNRDFNLIRGNINIIQGTGYKAYIEKGSKQDAYIYIFDNRDLINVGETLGYNRLDTYKYIAEKVHETVLMPYDDNILMHIYKSDKREDLNEEMFLTEEEMYEQLYGYNIQNEVVDLETKSTTKKNILIYKMDKETGKLKQLDKNDLLRSLPNSLKAEKEYAYDEEKNNQENLKDKYKENDFNIDINQIISTIANTNDIIIGQEDAVIAVATNIKYNQDLINKLSVNGYISESELDSRKACLLLDGPTGTGKTAIVKLVTKSFNLPLVIRSAKSFSETGFVGASITDMLEELIKNADGDIQRAERGIIVLDEIDKLAANKDQKDSMKKGVQEELLTFIGGGKVDIKNGKSKNITFDTTRITFILMGAFTDIREAKIKEIDTNRIGFGDEENKEQSYEIVAQDYIDYGLQRELVGRIKVIQNTKAYTKEDLTNILLNSKISPLLNLEKTAKMYGYGGIKYDDDFIEKVIDKAYEMDTGARSLQTVMLGLQNILLLEMMTNNVYDEAKKVELTDEVLEKYEKNKVMEYKKK